MVSTKSVKQRLKELQEAKANITNLMEYQIVTVPNPPPQYIGEKLNITSSRDISALARNMYILKDVDINVQEAFFVVFLSRSNNVIGFLHLSTGGTAGTVVDPKFVFFHAIQLLASAVILVHNHPSKNLKPSTQDINLTNQLRQAALLLDMQVLDHIIITSESYFSFADEGML